MVDIPYKAIYCDQIIDYFSITPLKEVEVNHYKNGKVAWTDTKLRANPLPTFSGFAQSIGLKVTNTLDLWTLSHTDFAVSYNRARELQVNFLIENGLNGTYAQLAFKFVATNLTEMTDTKRVEEQRDIKVELYMPDNGRAIKPIAEAKKVKAIGNIEEAKIAKDID